MYQLIQIYLVVDRLELTGGEERTEVETETDITTRLARPPRRPQLQRADTADLEVNRRIGRALTHLIVCNPFFFFFLSIL